MENLTIRFDNRIIINGVEKDISEFQSKEVPHQQTTKVKDISLRDLTLQQLLNVSRIADDLDFKIQLDNFSKKLLKTRFGVNVTDFNSKKLIMFMSGIGYTPIYDVIDEKESSEENRFIVGWESTIKL